MLEGEQETPKAGTERAGANAQQPALSPGYYAQAETALKGPLSELEVKQLAECQLLWWTDGLHSYGPFTAGQVRGSQVSNSTEAGDDSQEPAQASYSEAARAALEPDEQHLAELARQAGTSLQDLVQFCYSSSHAPREEDTDDRPADQTEAVEEASSEPRGPGRGWRKLSKIKKQRKEKQRTAWLFS